MSMSAKNCWKKSWRRGISRTISYLLGAQVIWRCFFQPQTPPLLSLWRPLQEFHHYQPQNGPMKPLKPLVSFIPNRVLLQKHSEDQVSLKMFGCLILFKEMKALVWHSFTTWSHLKVTPQTMPTSETQRPQSGQVLQKSHLNRPPWLGGPNLVPETFNGYKCI